MVRVVVAAASTVGVAGVDESHLTTGSQTLMAVSSSMSLWNNLPSWTEHAAAAGGDGDAHKHSSTKTTEAEKVLLL
jgi:hypothetical protein